MTKRSIVLIMTAVVLASVFVAFRLDWFRKEQIQILPLIRPPLRGSRAVVPQGDVPVYPVNFQFEKKFQFNEVRVVAVDDEKTNKYPHAVWHMISDSNSVPLKMIQYGAPLRGMKPKVPRAQAEPLQPDVTYRLYLTAGKARGSKTFVTHELVKPEPATP
jgi:hypothetical protein